MKPIPVHKGNEVVGHSAVDDDIYEEAIKYKWRFDRKGKEIFTHSEEK